MTTKREATAVMVEEKEGQRRKTEEWKMEDVSPVCTHRTLGVFLHRLIMHTRPESIENESEPRSCHLYTCLVE